MRYQILPFVELLLGAKPKFLLRFLEPLVRASTYDSAEERAHPRRGVSFASVAGRKVREFIEVYFYELRNLICKRAKTNFSVSSQTTIAIAGLTHWLMEHFGMHAEYAKSLATGILVAILTATKGAFCKMTAHDAKTVLARIRQ